MLFGHGSSVLDSETTGALIVDILPDNELVKSVEQLKKQVKILQLENKVLEASIVRLQPSLMAGVYTTLEYALKWSQSQVQRAGSGTTVASSSRSLTSRIGFHDGSLSYSTAKNRSSMLHRSSIRGAQSSIRMSKSIIVGAGPKVNVEERLELVHAVMEKEGKDLKKCRDFAKKQRDYLDAQLEEIGLRSDTFQKWTEAFEQEVVIEGVDTMTKRIPAEIWIRFLTEQGRKIDRQVDKLRIRMSTANIQHRKLRDDIKHKKDMAERLVPVDFEVTSIAISSAQKTVDMKNMHVVALKALTGEANLNLTIYKKRMMAKTNYLEKVRNLTTVRERHTVKLDAERDVLATQVVNLEGRLGKLQKMRQKYLVPDVLEYVSIQNRMSELKSSIKRLETSLYIKNFALVNFKKEKRKSMVLFSKKMQSLKSVAHGPP